MNVFSLHPRKLFFIDAIGALVSTVLLGGVLTYFKEYFGMSVSILKILAVLAFLLFGYSLWHYLRFPRNWRIFLQGMALFNVIYCLLTGILVISYWEELTILGKLYFSFEISIVSGLIFLEWKKAIAK